MISNIFSQRPFNIDDGNRYIILVKINDTHQVFTRKYKHRAIVSKTFKDGKTFKDLQGTEKVIHDVFTKGRYDYEVYQVKDIFEPRYYVCYKDRTIISEPHIKCRQDWFIIDEVNPNTFKTYQDALSNLEKHKSNLIEYYYQKIMALKEVNLSEIGKG